MRRAIISALTLIMLLAATPPAASAVPYGFRVGAREFPAPGVEVLELVSDRPPLTVHVAQISPSAKVALRAMLSNDLVSGNALEERTSSMCRRVSCLVAVNGDFSDPDTRMPLGAVVSSGEMLRSPNPSHHQLVIDQAGDLHAVNLAWSGKIVSTDLKELAIDGINVERPAGKVILYTTRFGASTGTNPHGAEIAAALIEPPGPLRIGQTARVRLTRFEQGKGSMGIPQNGFVLSGHGSGAAALADLWQRIESSQVSREVFLRLDAGSGATESVGGTPILLRDGRQWFVNSSQEFFTSRHPRTMAGWDAKGRVWLVTVDGRDPGRSEGMTMGQAARFMAALGATEAINLDGGGSTTFVVKGEVANIPSDRVVRIAGDPQIVQWPGKLSVLGRVERPVASALVVVPLSHYVFTSPGPPTGDWELPRAIALPSLEGDPASSPGGSLPGLLFDPPKASSLLAGLALALNLVALAGLAWAVRRSRPRPITSSLRSPARVRATAVPPTEASRRRRQAS